MLLRERQSGPSGEDRPDGDDDASYRAPRGGRWVDRVLGRDDAADPRRRAARRGVIGVLAGALVMLVAATALAVTGQGLDVLGVADQQPSAAGGADPEEDEDVRPALTTEPGRCLTWSRDDAGDVREVDCAQPHLFESVGAVNAAQPPGAPFSDDAAWQQLVTDQCLPAARNYLQGRLDPAGRYRAGALKPTQAAWDGGDRTVRCGLQAPGRTGALFPSQGRVADADQAVVFDAGTCLGLVGKEVSDPVACGETHAAEVAGIVDLGTQFRESFPSVDDQDNYLQPTCQRIAEQYVGSAQKLTDSKLIVYWTNLAEESWTAGTRRVTCNLGSLLSDNSGFAPLRGKAADGVTIGGEAPTTAPSLRPGAPATIPGSTTPAPDDGAATGGTAGEPGTGRTDGGGRPGLPLPSVPVPGLNGG
ncbi:septum formation family protein [Actinomycetospora cinnamomea]|uniref:Putative regulator of septum formation n=1 Tax=Actinomycetospora cinnamomea TaxID=663609 RepID=A0A2U1FBM1_9PSEU|nr:septum formation family protein [Actinomycetospora cinnamomea]PVZ09593.1 putative regulator of septum formation [Actinomycetospora cinnamomea]